MLRGRTKSLAVETTHINDILRVRDIKNCFNESLFNCLSFSRSKFVNLPHCRQHCHIHPRLHCIRNPIFELWSHQTPGSSHPPSRNSSFAIQGPSFGIQAGFIKPPWQVHASFATSTFTESTESFVTSPSRNPFRPLQPSIHVQSAAFDALAEPSPSCYTHMLQTMVANESARLGESGRGRQVRAGAAAK